MRDRVRRRYLRETQSTPPRCDPTEIGSASKEKNLIAKRQTDAKVRMHLKRPDTSQPEGIVSSKLTRGPAAVGRDYTPRGVTYSYLPVDNSIQLQSGRQPDTNDSYRSTSKLVHFQSPMPDCFVCFHIVGNGIYVPKYNT